MTLPRSQWTPILNEADEQIGWNIGAEEIRFSTPQVFLQVEGVLQLAIGINRVSQGKVTGEKKPKATGRKRGKVAPKPPRGRR